MMRAQLAMALGCSMMAACGSSAPNTPTPPPPAATWSLSGIVSSSAGGGINAANVAILDGPDVNKQTITDVTGRYNLAGLHQAGFSLRASAKGFTAVTQGVTLTANTVTDFQLPRLPVAALTFEGELVFVQRADGAFDIRATGVNSGEGCATSVSGVTALTGSTGASFSFTWTLPPATLIRPGDRFSYTLGSMSRADVIQLGSTGTYVTTFTFISTGC